MIEVYDCRPEYKNIKYTLRLVEQADCDDLLKVYSDAKSRPFLTVIIVMAMISVTLLWKK